MATDATGTPTSLGIPTYNVNVDAPSGNGNNAQMQAIDALIVATRALIQPTRQIITASGTYTAPANVKAIDVEVLGGGGGAGSSGSPGNSDGAVGGSGGGGAYSRKLIVNPAASYAVTVGAAGVGSVSGTPGAGGAGGDTIFGSNVVLAKGGSGGAAGSAAVNGSVVGGAGGAAASGVGDLKVDGGNGGLGWWQYSATAGQQFAQSGQGGRGAGPYGSDGADGVILFGFGHIAGANAVNLYGAGGSGSVANGTSQLGNVAGNGTAGIIVVTEYY